MSGKRLRQLSAWCWLLSICQRASSVLLLYPWWAALCNHLLLSACAAMHCCATACCCCPAIHCLRCSYQAYTAAKKGDDVLCATALAQLSSLLQGMPVLEAGSSQVGLISDELKGWADGETLQRLYGLAMQLVEPQQQQLVSSMLGMRS